MEKLTERQQEALRVLRDLRDRNGITPTQRELAAALGVTQGAARALVRTLARKKYVLLFPRSARGIVVLD